jgi:hypothetical protein
MVCILVLQLSVWQSLVTIVVCLFYYPLLSNVYTPPVSTPSLTKLGEPRHPTATS